MLCTLLSQYVFCCATSIEIMLSWFSGAFVCWFVHDVFESLAEWYDISLLWKTTTKNKKIEIRSWIVTHRIVKMLQTNMIRSSKESNRDKRRARGNFSLPQVNNKKKTTNNNNKSKPDFRSVYNRSRTHKESGTHFVEVQIFVSPHRWAAQLFSSFSSSPFRICFRCFRYVFTWFAN